MNDPLVQSSGARPRSSRRFGRRLKALHWLGILALLLLLCGALLPFEFAYEPAISRGLNAQSSLPSAAYDVWGTPVSKSEAAEKLLSAAAGAELSPARGAVAIDAELLELGRSAFYTETFGNEVFLTDVLGILNGPLTFPAFLRAIGALGGRGTSNLRVELAHDATVGGRFFRKGTPIDTGLDVPRGSYAPLGLALRKVGTTIKAGITCAACHSSVDPLNFELIHGAPNSDLNAGWLLAMASNSASFFVHTGIDSLARFTTLESPPLRDSEGGMRRLPNSAELEEAVDAQLLQWPRGSFDSMIDLVSAPTQLPDSFTFEDYPYGYSGASMVGPFRGLSVQNNNMHALNSDALTHMDASQALFGIDKEVYIGVLLQNAASSRYRYDPGSGERPSEFLRAVDPTPQTPALNEMVLLPTYPKVTLIAPDGLWTSSPGLPIWRQVNAMSAWQNTLIPPPPPGGRHSDVSERGREVFEKAGCASCHSGPAYTNHRILEVNEIGTEPARARGLQRTQALFAGPLAFAFDQNVPLPNPARILPVPVATLDPQQIQLAFAQDGSRGGYKTPGLLGLYWSAPYLHDGGVAVGPNLDLDLGMAGTLNRGVLPDPTHSLRALVDRRLRARVVAANQADRRLQRMHVTGQGHEFWVDEAAGFDAALQSALIHYLLQLRALPERGAPRAERRAP